MVLHLTILKFVTKWCFLDIICLLGFRYLLLTIYGQRLLWIYFSRIDLFMLPPCSFRWLTWFQVSSIPLTLLTIASKTQVEVQIHVDIQTKEIVAFLLLILKLPDHRHSRRVIRFETCALLSSTPFLLEIFYSLQFSISKWCSILTIWIRVKFFLWLCWLSTIWE